MATKTFNTRIRNKIDTFANWTKNDPVLLNGEIGIVVVPASTGAVQQEPAILIKIGDGTKKFSELEFISSKAADVYDWAKASTKPTYAATEISGLSNYIAGQIQDTDTQYKIEADAGNARKFYLYSKPLNGSWGTTPVSTIEIPETVYTLATGTANGTVKFNGTDVAVKGLGSAAYTDASAYDASGSANAALASAKSYADGKDAAISAAKKAGDDAQADVDALAGKVGAVPGGKTVVQMIAGAQADVDALETKVGAVSDGKTVVQMIADAQAAATYDDTALKGRVAVTETAIDTLNGNGDGSVKKQVADAVAGIVADAPEAYDTLKEISDWISTHASDASSMNSQINTNKNAIATLNGTGAGSVSKAVADAKADVQSKIDTHTNNTTVHITADERTAWNGKTTMSAVEAKGYQTAAQVKAIKVNNATAADKLKTARTISLTGDATGSADFDGSEAISIAVTVADDSHNHVISNVDGLQNALDAKATPADITAAIGNLDVSDTAVAGQVVSSVSEADGKISVTRRQVKIDELGQDAYIIFDCGTSSTII